MMKVSLKLLPLLLVIPILPVEPSIFGPNDDPDFVSAYENHFASPVIQLRSLMVTWTHWIANLTAWILLGNIWAFIRGPDYDANLNITTVWNKMVSDTESFQNTIKAGSFGGIAIILWQTLGHLGGPPVPVPQAVPTGRKRRDVSEEEFHLFNRYDVSPPNSEERKEHDSSLVDPYYDTKNYDSMKSLNSDQTIQMDARKVFDIQEEAKSDESFQKILDSGSEDSSSGIPRTRRQARSQSFYQDVFIPAMNQNLEPKGIGRNTMIGTVVALAQTIFWLGCAIFLPQGLFG